ncbi:MAG: RagB/SusD family nutrient uptake outer membrane protein [Longimicrobiales bacterium]
MVASIYAEFRGQLGGKVYNFNLPTTWVQNQTYTSAQLVQLAYTMLARILVYTPRTPEERATVNWQKVLDATSKGLTYDFGPTLQSGLLTSTYFDRMQATTRARADNKLVGPSDVSGNYQAWLARRRNGAATTLQALTATVDENRLLRAEAMFRTGNLTEAANLINVSRTRAVRIGTTTHPGLPAVTATGVPESTPTAPCVPRTNTGACGSLLDALRYERQIELAGLDPMRAWMDYRGFGQLTSGTILQMPIPGRYLVSLEIPLYTFGGVGGQSAAR